MNKPKVYLTIFGHKIIRIPYRFAKKQIEEESRRSQEAIAEYERRIEALSDEELLKRWMNKNDES